MPSNLWKGTFDLAPVETREQGIAILECVGTIFYVAASFYFLIGLFSRDPNMLGESPIWLTLGHALRVCRSRAAAILAALYSLAEGWMAVAFRFGHPDRDIFVFKTNFEIIVIAVLFLASLRAIRASVAYHKLSGSQLILKNVIIKNLLAIVYLAGCLFGLRYLETSTWPEMATLKKFVLDHPQQRPALLEILVLLIPALTYRGWMPFAGRRPFVTAPGCES